jgi:hypothetical protein
MLALSFVLNLANDSSNEKKPNTTHTPQGLGKVSLALGGWQMQMIALFHLPSN